MITNKNVKKRRVKKLLERFGGGASGSATPDRFPEELPSDIHHRVSLRPGEESLIASFRDNTSWCLLTTERCLWFEDGKLRALPWLNIHGIQQPPALSARIIRGDQDKNTANELEIFDAEGSKHTLRIAPGRDYHLVWSAILVLGNITRQPDPINLDFSIPDNGLE